MTAGKLPEIISEFVTKGWRESSFNKYFVAPRKLYQNKIYIPLMGANAAPAAFQVEKEVKPSVWIVVYRGQVVAPKTGRFRFVGAGDDAMVVRFNGTNVLDHGFVSGTTGIAIAGKASLMAGNGDFKDLERSMRRHFPVKFPVKFYQYPTTQNWNAQIGGLGVGAEFDVIAGKDYPIEILISEIPGGAFCAALLIEEVGVTYEKSPSGAPIIPLFRTDSSVPKATGQNAPPFSSGPVWRVKKSGGGIGF